MSKLSPESKRIAVVDFLRAFALLGIVIAHSTNGFLSGPSPTADFNDFSYADHLVSRLDDLLISGKFYCIFAFLFGVGFSLQLHGASRRGEDFTGRFAWRMVVLFAIGFVHAMFFSGDALTIYALLGLLLIPVRKLGSRVLLVTGLVLVLNVPGFFMNLARVDPMPRVQQSTAVDDANVRAMHEAEREFEIKSAGTLGELVKLNTTQSLEEKLEYQVITGRLWITFGLFLLGLCAGRAGLFRQTAANRSFFLRMALGCGIVAALTSVMVHVHLGFQNRSAVDALAGFAFSVRQFTLSAFYVSALTLLFWYRPAWLSQTIAPVGRMSLTSYLAQSAFAIVAFYGIGFGLMQAFGAATCVALAIGFYVLQICFARWWLGRFTMGPVEWLWRSLTYLEVQPLSRPLPQTA